MQSNTWEKHKFVNTKGNWTHERMPKELEIEGQF